MGGGRWQSVAQVSCRPKRGQTPSADRYKERGQTPYSACGSDWQQPDGLHDGLLVRLQMPVAPQDVFHAVLDLQLALLESDFFELFGF